MADPMQDPSADPGVDPGETEGQGGGFSVTITDNGDGTYSVSSSDSDSDPSAGDAGDGSGSGGAAGPQTAQSVEEAVEMAGALLEQESNEDSGGDDNAPLPSKDAAQSVWNQMASKRDKARAT